MPLDPQVKVLLDRTAALGLPPLEEMGVASARALFRSMRELAGKPEEVATVENRTIPGPAGEIPVRIYTPEGKGPFPILVFFHGGGFVLCDLDTHDTPVRALANRARCVAVSVAYRLAPENLFPAAPEDCYAASRCVADNAAKINGDPTRIAVGGDSAGGNLAAVVALMARDRGGPPLAFQLLVYPATANDLSFPSVEENDHDYFLTKSAMVWFGQHYVRSEADLDNPYMSPLRAKDHKNLPPGLVLTAEYDPLRDEGEAYARKLREAGVAMMAKRYYGAIHGILHFAGVLEVGRQLIEDAGEALRDGLA